jgi:ABC-type lipoprotein release transport system permease subunit
MRVMWSWLRIDLRRRWRSLAVLMLLVTLVGATVMTALAGARRGTSALTRLSARTLPATTAVLANTPGFDWSQIEALPEVAALNRFVVSYDMALQGLGGDGLGFAPADDATMRTVEKPVIFKGRVFNEKAADEAVVSPSFVAHNHKGVGDTVTLLLPTPSELAASETGGTGALSGPRVTLHIVGVGRSPWFIDPVDSTGGLLFSPGVTAKYFRNIIGDPAKPQQQQFVNALVRLRGGEGDLARFREDVAKVTGRSDIDIWNLPEQNRAVARHVTFETRCLVAFAAAAFVAALFLVGQAIARYAAAAATELQTLRALGMTPGQAVAIAAAGPTLSGMLAAVMAGVGAWIASEWMPMGTAAHAEPSPGRSIDWVVFGPSIPVIALLVAAASSAAAWLTLRSALRSKPARRSSIARTVSRAGLPVPVVVGTRFALEPGRGRSAVPVRPAIIGAVTGVLGILAAFTFSHGVSDAAHNPARFGQTYQLTAYLGFNDKDFVPGGPLLTALNKNASVTGVDDSRTAVATGPHGVGSVSLFEYRTGSKSLPVVVTSGRLPAAADEVLLGPTTLRGLHVHVGEHVELTGDGKPQRVLVTGSGLVPQGPHNGYADGGFVTSAGYSNLFKGFKYHIVFITLTPAARTPDAGATLAAALVKQNPTLKGTELQPPDKLQEVAEIEQVRVLPIVLGGFLAVLAIGAVGHALATAVRRREHDLAVLRALGMTQWQCRWVTVTQATLLALIGLVFGVPLGVAIGRTLWRAVANYTPIQYVPPAALWALALIGPAALLLANLLAAWPGHRAARLRIAHILRAE